MHNPKFSPAKMRRQFAYRFSTKVTNPLYRYGEKPFGICPMCDQFFTQLGLKRHLNRCGEVRKKGGRK